MKEHENILDLPALDGANPLGFLAALGALRVLSETDPEIKLGWRAQSRWTPLLTSPEPLEESKVLQALAKRLRGKAVNAENERIRAAAQKRFAAAKTQLRNAEKRFKDRGLKGKERETERAKEVEPYEAAFQASRTEKLFALKDAVPSPELALGDKPDCTIEEFRQHARTMKVNSRVSDRLAADMLAGFGAEPDNCDEETISPTPFCFLNGAGHQWFLETANKLMASVTEPKLREALFIPWDYSDMGLCMRWDPLDDRRYALMDRDPTASDNKSSTVWMANLLAYRALTFFPNAVINGGIGVAGWINNAATNSFTWPIWNSGLDLSTIGSLLQSAIWVESDLTKFRSVLRERGVVAVFRCSRLRTGKYTNFSPAVAV